MTEMEIVYGQDPATGRYTVPVAVRGAATVSLTEMPDYLARNHLRIAGSFTVDSEPLPVLILEKIDPNQPAGVNPADKSGDKTDDKIDPDPVTEIVRDLLAAAWAVPGVPQRADLSSTLRLDLLSDGGMVQVQLSSSGEFPSPLEWQALQAALPAPLAAPRRLAAQGRMYLKSSFTEVSNGSN